MDDPRTQLVDDLITRSARAIASLAPTIGHLESLEQEREAIDAAIGRGHFAPAEEDRLRGWFARFLTARAELLETIDDLEPVARGRAGWEVDDAHRLRAFLIAYTAACLAVRAARFLVDEVATHTVVQRKLNESAPGQRLPRKQYTKVYRSLTHPFNAWRLAEAMRFADTSRAAIDALDGDPIVAPLLPVLAEAEPALRIGVRRYARARLRYRWHSWRRRRASAVQRGLFQLLETSGRIMADVQVPHRDRVTERMCRELEPMLRPGDVIVTRHDQALTNLFLPGYWPHASLYVGPPSTRRTLGIELSPDRCRRWVEPLCVLEARKDGVLFRALTDTLAVDAFAVIRPQIDEAAVRHALANAIAHEGKLYNFDFDFFTDGRLVCTEVVYRGFEGVGGLSFRLIHRGGRITLSAEDLLDMALESRGFAAVAVFGTPSVGARLATGDDARHALAASYRIDRPPER